MKIPGDDAKKLDLYREVREACLASRQDRLDRYAANRRWFLYGNVDGEAVSPWNKIYPHLDTVTSFLYASETTKFALRLKSRASRADLGKKTAVTKRINEEWKESNADIIWGSAIMWALVYDSTLVKHIRRGGQLHPFVVDPGSFGVYREDVPMLDRQEAFTHVYYMTLTDLERQLALHPKREDILKNVRAARAKDDTQSRMPPIVDRVVMSAVTPNMIGEANVPLDAPPDYTAKIDVELVEMCEAWIWNDAEDDYQVVTMASDQAVVYDRPNIFIPRSRLWEAEQPFVQCCPNPLYDYFWGQSELARLAPLQGKRNEAFLRIENLLKKKVDPPNAWFGMGINEEKLLAFKMAGASIPGGGDPSFRRETYVPDIPADLYAEVKQNDADFDEVSGLTNVLAGRGESGVRSSGHAGKLLTVGSARPKKRALIIEDSLEKSATLYGKCLYLDDDEALEDAQGHKFVIAQMSPHFAVDVDGHSNSPVFMENQRENAVIMLKARAITRKRFIQMLAPPMEEDLIHDLETEIIPGEKAAAQAQQQAEAAKGKLSAVK